MKLNAGRNVTGVLRGYDQFMNVVLDHSQGCNAREHTHTHTHTERERATEQGGVMCGWGRGGGEKGGHEYMLILASLLLPFPVVYTLASLCVQQMQTRVHAQHNHNPTHPPTRTSDVCLCVAEHVVGSKTEKKEIGMVVVRGNSIAMIECVDKVFG